MDMEERIIPRVKACLLYTCMIGNKKKNDVNCTLQMHNRTNVGVEPRTCRPQSSFKRRFLLISHVAYKMFKMI